MNLILLMAVCLGMSLIFSEVFFRLKIPKVLGQILAGIVLGIPFIKVIFTAENLSDISFLAELGVVFLLLLVGLEISLRKMRKTKKDSLIIAISAAVVPFILGFGLMRLLDYDYVTAIAVGACLSLTAEGTKIVVLIEHKMLKTRVGTIMLGAGILDNIFEVLFLALLLVYVQKSNVSIAIFPVTVIAFMGITLLLLKFIPRVMRVLHKDRSKIASFSTMLVIGLSIAALSSLMGLGPVIGAFIGGIFLQKAIVNRKEEQEDVKELRMISFALIVPFFFINIGMHLDFQSLVLNFNLFVLIIITAIAGKILGTIIVTPFTNLNLKQTTLIGWGMNSRGAIELVIAEIARMNGLISIEVYSAIIAMAVLTTFMFPFILRYYTNKYPDIMK